MSRKHIDNKMSGVFGYIDNRRTHKEVTLNEFNIRWR